MLIAEDTVDAEIVDISWDEVLHMGMRRKGSGIRRPHADLYWLLTTQGSGVLS